MLPVNLPVLSTIHPQSNKFVTGVRTKAMGDSKLNDSLLYAVVSVSWDYLLDS